MRHIIGDNIWVGGGIPRESYMNAEPLPGHESIKFTRSDKIMACEGCGRLGSDYPAPPALSCCPERKLVLAQELIDKLWAATYQIEQWRGIWKVIEESGELLQVLGKLGAFPDGIHPDGAGDLIPRAGHEVADLQAALDYFTGTNGALDYKGIDQRRRGKLIRFRDWVLSGVKK